MDKPVSSVYELVYDENGQYCHAFFLPVGDLEGHLQQAHDSSPACNCYYDNLENENQALPLQEDTILAAGYDGPCHLISEWLEIIILLTQKSRTPRLRERWKRPDSVKS